MTNDQKYIKQNLDISHWDLVISYLPAIASPARNALRLAWRAWLQARRAGKLGQLEQLEIFYLVAETINN